MSARGCAVPLLHRDAPGAAPRQRRACKDIWPNSAEATENYRQVGTGEPRGVSRGTARWVLQARGAARRAMVQPGQPGHLTLCLLLTLDVYRQVEIPHALSEYILRDQLCSLPAC